MEIKYNNLKYLTVPIECGGYFGTGFFVLYSIDGEEIPVIVTAAHVVRDEAEAVMTFRYKPNEGHIATAKITCKPAWITHEKDLCICRLQDVNQRFEQLVGYPIFYRCIAENRILTKDERDKTAVLSEVIMLGYPDGILNQPNIYPMFEKGYLSSIPSENEAIGAGYIDITSIAGSSGSPILMIGEESRLAGILIQGVNTGEDNSSELGKYVDACSLLDLKEQLMKEHRKEM